MKSIFETTCGRCGTHWLKKILAYVLNFEIELPEVKNFKNSIERMKKYPKVILKKENNNFGNNIYTFHISIKDLEIIKDIVNIIVLVRDLRDVCVSAAYYYMMKGEIKEKDIPNRIIELLDTGGPNPYFNDSYLKHHSNIPHLLIKYENLIDDTYNTVKKILDKLNYTYDSNLLYDSVDKYNFKHFSGGRMPGQEDKKSHFRKGIVGDWKNYISDNNNEKFLNKYGHLMRLWGYDV